MKLRTDNLNTPADADLSRCASVFFCYLENGGVAEDLTLGQRTVPFKHNSLLTTVLHQVVGLLERMVLHLMGNVIECTMDKLVYVGTSV